MATYTRIALKYSPTYSTCQSTPSTICITKKLDDFYVLYELNVYISKSGEIELAKSEIYQHILNDFLAAGIEMNGPHLFAKLDHVPQYQPKNTDK
ncbi:hypothetical protein D3C80_770860 [compost metagenome]